MEQRDEANADFFIFLLPFYRGNCLYQLVG